MILGKGQVTSPDLFVTAMQCLGSLKTEPALHLDWFQAESSSPWACWLQEVSSLM